MKSSQVKKTLLDFSRTMFTEDSSGAQPEEMVPKCSQYENTFDGGSLAGFNIKYQLTVQTEPETPAPPHYRGSLIRISDRDSLLKAFNEKFIQWMKETNRHFNFSHTHGLVRVVHLRDDGKIIDELNCSDTVSAFQKIHFTGYGCRASLLRLDAWIDRDDAALIKENHSMIDDTSGNPLMTEVETRKIEEAWVIALLNERLKVQEEWKTQLHFGSNRTHKGIRFNLQTECRGSEVVIKWNFNNPKNQRYHMRGFRSENPFTLDIDDKTQGVLVIDRWGDDWVTEHLEAGKTYFYTLRISRTFFYTNEVIMEDFRFEITTAPRDCMDVLENKLSKWIEKIKTPVVAPPVPISAKQQEINRIFEQLNSYVEFDEDLTQREKSLIKEIEAKNYPAKERKEKIERLKLIAEDLRQQHL